MTMYSYKDWYELWTRVGGFLVVDFGYIWLAICRLQLLSTKVMSYWVRTVSRFSLGLSAFKKTGLWVRQALPAWGIAIRLGVA